MTSEKKHIRNAMSSNIFIYIRRARIPRVIRFADPQSDRRVGYETR